MAVLKYKDPQTGRVVVVGGSGGSGTDIPIQDTQPTNSSVWIDTSVEGGEYIGGGEYFDGGGIAIQEDEPTGSEQLWVDLDENGVEENVAGIAIQPEEPTDGRQVWIDTDDDESLFSGMELVWENASPSSEFAVQDIVVDLSNFTHYAVLYLRSTADAGAAALSIYFIPVGFDTVMTDGIFAIYRSMKATENGFWFGNGSDKTGANAVADNSKIIPWRIYGIKGGVS